MTERRTGEDAAALLPEELLWAAGGHASDVVLGVLADGQLDIVPASVRAHVEGCPACTTHLGHAALLSLHVGQELDAVRAHERAADARQPLPRTAIVLGLVVAALGLVPGLLDVGASPSGALGGATVLARGATSFVQAVLAPGSRLGLLLTYGTAAALVVAAIVLVKVLPRKEVSS